MEPQKINFNNEYLGDFTNDDRLKFCKKSTGKYNNTNYDIILDNELKNTINVIINSGICSEEQFTSILNSLNINDIKYIYRQYLLQEYIDGYNDDNRFNFCKLALRKYRFEKYRMNSNNIAPEDYVIQNISTRNKIQNVINTGICSIENFTNIFNTLEIDDINYIGY